MTRSLNIGAFFLSRALHDHLQQRQVISANLYIKKKKKLRKNPKTKQTEREHGGMRKKDKKAH